MKKILKGNKPLVGVFDSGIGGLNFLKVCVQKLPQADYVYCADNKHVPYGNLPQERVWELVNGKVQKLIQLGCDVVVLACNTATAVCLERLRQNYSIPFVGIQPAIKQATAQYSHVAVLATCATVKSAPFQSLMARYGRGRALAFPCPQLAEEIERNIYDLGKINLSLLLPTVNPDAVVLGCTHYAFLSEPIAKYYNCPVFDGMLGTVNHLCTLLGITDHQPLNCPKITFVGGEFAKNNEIFAKITVEL
jgi:glutamate racemase